MVWDNESAVGSWRAGRPKLTEEFDAFRGMLGVKVIQCRPRDPEAKGLVERANGYLETSFLPGPHVRQPGRLQRPAAGVAGAGEPAPAPPPGLPPGRPARSRFGRRCSPCRRSCRWWGGGRRYGCRATTTSGSRATTTPSHPSAVGRRVEVAADLETVTITCAGRQVGQHPRCWAAASDASPTPPTRSPGDSPAPPAPGRVGPGSSRGDPGRAGRAGRAAPPQRLRRRVRPRRR